MRSGPLWIPSKRGPVFACVHVPASGRARAVVLICPPIGFEYHEAHPSLIVLAERLTAAGVAAMRLDYQGTGDSAGDSRDPDRLGAWSASVEAALDHIAEAYSGPVVVLGVRMGATLAALSVGHPERRPSKILWDPVISGRTWVSAQKALQALTSRAAVSASGHQTYFPGLVSGTDEVKRLRQVVLTARDVAADRCLCIGGSQTLVDELSERLGADRVQWAAPGEETPMLERGSSDGFVAMKTLDLIVDWVARLAADADTPVSLTAGEPHLQVVANGKAYRESTLRTSPQGLFAIVTEPLGGTPGPTGPTAIFLNAAAGNHSGPYRLWVELARSWAALGVRSARVDLSGLGDSPPRDGYPRFVSASPAAFDDVEEACKAVSPEDPSNVVLVGTCSTGYQVLESALNLRPRAVIAIVPALSFPLPELSWGSVVDPRRRIAVPVSVGAGSLSRLAWLRRLRPYVGRWAPLALAARLVRRLRRAKFRRPGGGLGRGQASHPVSMPGVWIPELLKSGARVVVIGDDETLAALCQGVSTNTFATWAGSGLEFYKISDSAFGVPDEREEIINKVTALIAQLAQVGGPRQPRFRDALAR